MTPKAVQPWSEAESFRHLVLLEAVRRGPGLGESEVSAALAEFADLQRTDPVRASHVLRLPQVGVWAARYLRDGCTSHPTYLRALVDKTGAETRTGIVLEPDDPYLDLYGERDPTPDIEQWRVLIDTGLGLVAQVDPETAAAMDETLRVIVPLRSTGRPHSATSGWAYGAIASSLPTQAMECAEMLVHEFGHVVLGAVLNHVKLVRPGDWRGHAPWRSDPRPAEGLLQGCYAHAGLIRFWERLLGTEHAGQAAPALERWRAPTRQAITDLHESGVLTDEGHRFVEALRLSL